MPLSQTKPDGISTINEDFYNNIERSYISDDEDDDDYDIEINGGSSSDASSDTADPFPSPNTNKSSKDRKIPRSEATKANPSSKREHDSLLQSENSNETKDSSSKRDISGIDTLLLSERSNPIYTPRRDASGYDSLLVSETTDETWRRMVTFPYDDDDDGSSISSTPTTPFPNLVGDSPSFMAPMPPTIASLSSHDAKMAEKIGKGSWREGADRPDSQESRRQGPPLSQRMIAMIESPPFVSAVPAAAAATTDSVENSNVTLDDDDEGQAPDGVCEIKVPSRSDINETKEIEIETENKTDQSKSNNHGDYRYSISTAGSLHDNDRAHNVPRRWIVDRIDGTVKVSEEEEERLPLWRRRPPCFLCLPSPLVGIFPWWLEENSCCVTVGKWGHFGSGGVITKDDNAKKTTHGAEPEASNAAANPIADDNGSVSSNPGENSDFLRTLVMGHALLLNACGLLATILSGLALTRSNSSLLEAVPFSKTTLIPALSSPSANSDSDDAVTLYLGLLALGIDNPNASVGGTILVKFRDFCATPGIEQFLLPEDCDRCADVGPWMVLGFFLATMAHLPTFAIGIGRLYKNYDANCSKVAASVWSLVSLVGYVMVLSCYYSSCLESLFEGGDLYTSGGAIYEENLDLPLKHNNLLDPLKHNNLLDSGFEWKVGVGQILFLIGLVLKIFEFVSNCYIATPRITRSRELQWDYEEDPASRSESHENRNPQEGGSPVNREQGGDGLGHWNKV